MMERGEPNFVNTNLQKEIEYHAVLDNALNNLKLYGKFYNKNVDTTRYNQTKGGDEIMQKIQFSYNEDDFLPMQVEVIKSVFPTQDWVIVIDADNNKCFYSLDGKQFIDDADMKKIIKKQLWIEREEERNRKLNNFIQMHHNGGRMVPKALKSYLSNSKYKKKYYVDKGGNVYNFQTGKFNNVVEEFENLNNNLKNKKKNIILNGFTTKTKNLHKLTRNKSIANLLQQSKEQHSEYSSSNKNDSFENALRQGGYKENAVIQQLRRKRPIGQLGKTNKKISYYK